MSSEEYSLVADIGGTNARFALIESGLGIPHEPRNLVCAEYTTLVEALEAYLDMVAIGRPWQAAISFLPSYCRNLPYTPKRNEQPRRNSA